MLQLTYKSAEASVPYDVEFKRINPHVVEATGPNLIFSDLGFVLTRPNMHDNWDYSEYKTCYRAVEGGYQFSDDGSTYIPPDTRIDIDLTIGWDDKDNVMGIRPDSVSVRVYNGHLIYDTIIFTAEENWKHTLTKMPHDTAIMMVPEDVHGYDLINMGSMSIYKMDVPMPEEPTNTDIMVAITDCYELISNNAVEITDCQLAMASTYEDVEVTKSDITDLQLAVAELYELIGGND